MAILQIVAAAAIVAMCLTAVTVAAAATVVVGAPASFAFSHSPSHLLSFRYASLPFIR